MSSPAAPLSFPAFDRLLVALRGARLRVGPREVQRLERLFALEPHWTDDQLLQALRALLVRTPEEDDTLRRVWAAWEAEARASLAAPTPLERPPPPRVPLPLRRVFPWKRAAWTLVAVAAVVGALSHVRAPEPSVIAAPPPTPTQVTPPQSAPSSAPRATHYTERVPTLSARYKAPNAALPISLALLGAAAWVWGDLRRRGTLDGWLPHPAPAPHADGPTRLPMLPGDAPADRLPPNAARTLAWSVGRYISEDTTAQLDLDRTVALTARRAIFAPVYASEHHLRAVWLWVDEAARAPGLDAWAAELAATLRRAHVPVRIGWFWQVPDRIRWEEGEPFRPDTVEGARETALVGVLTDGRGLATAGATAYRRAELTRLLRGLAEWPRLVFADFGDGAYGLGAELAGHGLRAVHPDELPAALGATEAHPRSPPDVADLLAWKGAMALCWQDVSEATGQALRARLGMGMSAFAWRQVAARGADLSAERGRSRATGAWRCNPDDRVRLLDRLARLEGGEATTGNTGTLSIARQFWRARLEEERAARLADVALRWAGSAAEQAWSVEAAFLDLWDAPERAARTLFPLYAAGGPLRDEIRARLLLFSPSRSAGRIALGWRSPLSPAALVMFGEMGLPLARGRLAVPRRVGVAKGMVAAVALGLGLVVAGSTWEWVQPSFVGLEDPQSTAIIDGVAWAWSTRRAASVDVGWFQAATLEWADATAACEEPLEGGGVVLRCSATGDASTWHVLDGWPRQVVWWMRADPSHEGARDFAAAALDAGSADTVVIARAWTPTGFPAEVLLVSGGSTDEPGSVFVDNWVPAAAQLREITSLQPLFSYWDPNEAETFRLAPPPPTVAWSDVPAGTFQMGSEDNEDERPVHSVTLSAFGITTTEIANASYQVRDPAHAGQPALPAVNVTWYEADAYCRWLGSADPAWRTRLPTEAEWEYAARGTDGRTYPWGDEAPDATRAVYGRDDVTGPLRANSLPGGRGPFGTLHQAGNVWEWVGDWYGAYPAQRVDNPTGPKSGPGRVLRGGSSDRAPELLRSAFRGRNDPSNSGGNVGFRCARVPRSER